MSGGIYGAFAGYPGHPPDITTRYATSAPGIPAGRKFPAAMLSSVYGALVAYPSNVPSTNEMDSPSRLAGH